MHPNASTVETLKKYLRFILRCSSVKMRSPMMTLKIRQKEWACFTTVVNTRAIGRDPSVWSENAEEFVPERFADNGIDVTASVWAAAFRFELVLAQLAHCFKWESPEDVVPSDIDMSKRSGLSDPRANHLLSLPTYLACLNPQKMPAFFLSVILLLQENWLASALFSVVCFRSSDPIHDSISTTMM